MPYSAETLQFFDDIERTVTKRFHDGAAGMVGASPDTLVYIIRSDVNRELIELVQAGVSPHPRIIGGEALLGLGVEVPDA